MKTMLDYIKETPDVLKDMIERKDDIFREVLSVLKTKEISHIYITGSGTSCHAGIAAKNFIEDLLDVQVIPMFPNAFVDQNTIKGEKVILLGVSQSGGSTSTIRSLEVARERGNICISVGGEDNTPIENYGDYHIDIGCGVEKALAKTKGYTASMLILYLFGLELAKVREAITCQMYDQLLERLLATTNNTAYLIENSEKWVDSVKKELADKPQFMVVGYQNQMATVMEAALKMLETVRNGVSGYEVEEFMHGIYNAINEQSVLFYIGSASDVYYERCIKLMNYLSKTTKHQYLISSEENPNVHNLTLKFVDDEYFSPIEYIIPFQLISYLVAIEKGIDPSKPSDPEFHKNMNSKIQK